jgi:hypothetical protein
MTVEDIEKAIAQLSPAEFARFRLWFGQYDAEQFDKKIERDAKSGKLDELADRAINEFRKGRAREL